MKRRLLVQTWCVTAANMSRLFGEAGFNTFALLATMLEPPPKPKSEKPKPSPAGWIEELKQWKA